MNHWQKIVVGVGCTAALITMDLLKLNDPELRYGLMGLFSLLVTGHVAVNLPTINVGH